MSFADFSVFLYFDFSISTKTDPHKIIKTSPSAQKKKNWQNFHTQKQIHRKINLAKIKFSEDLSPYIYIYIYINIYIYIYIYVTNV